jgi:glycosyltransferase involved in cell wall biosynthesis
MIRPDVSVVIPTFNRKEYLQRAITSCFDGNESVDVEVVVVDDGSTDGTRDYLRALSDERMAAVFQENGGAPVARNRGLDNAKGRFIKFLDDDDWLATGALRDELKVLERSGADMSYAAYERVDSDGTTVRRIEAPEVEDMVSALLSGAVLTHLHRFMYRRELISGLRWNADLPCRQDVDFALTVAAEDPSFVRVNRVVSYLNQHEGERISTGRDSIRGGRVHAEVLLAAVQEMKQKGMFTEQRRRSAAEGLWQWAHLVAGQDLKFFDRLFREIDRLAPGFTPDRGTQVLSLLDAIVGPRAAEHITYPFRRMKYGLSDT